MGVASLFSRTRVKILLYVLYLLTCLKIAGGVANSVDSDQMCIICCLIWICTVCLSLSKITVFTLGIGTPNSLLFFSKKFNKPILLRLTLKNCWFAVLLPTHQNWPYPKKFFRPFWRIFFLIEHTAEFTFTTIFLSQTLFS